MNQSSQKRKNVSKPSKFAVILPLSIFLVLLGVAAVLLLAHPAGDTEGPRATPSPTDNGKYIYYGDRKIRVQEDVPVNSFTSEQFYYGEDGMICFTGDSAVYGIDVSSHQGEIDWAAVAAQGIDFAMIRVGYRGYSVGAVAIDSMFKANIEGALANGIDVGVYFFSQAISVAEAEEEAAFVLNAIAEYDITFPVVFDWEVIHEDGARSNGLASDILNDCAVAFCSMIETSGYRPAVYFYQNLGYFNYNMSVISQYDLWLAEYDDYPDFYYGFQMWQYTSTGAIDGIPADVDLNISFVDYGRTIRQTSE